MQQHIYYTKYALQFADMPSASPIPLGTILPTTGWPPSAEVPFKIRPPPLPSALGKGGGLLCEVYFTLIVETFSKQCNTHSAICKL